MGRRFVVRLSAELPDIGAELAGGALGQGTRVMLLQHTGQVFEVTVDASECTEQYVFERLHVKAQNVVSGRSTTPRAREGLPGPARPDTRAGLVRGRR